MMPCRTESVHLSAMPGILARCHVPPVGKGRTRPPWVASSALFAQTSPKTLPTPPQKGERASRAHTHALLDMRPHHAPLVGLANTSPYPGMEPVHSVPTNPCGPSILWRQGSQLHLVPMSAKGAMEPWNVKYASQGPTRIPLARPTVQPAATTSLNMQSTSDLEGHLIHALTSAWRVISPVEGDAGRVNEDTGPPHVQSAILARTRVLWTPSPAYRAIISLQMHTTPWCWGV